MGRWLVLGLAAALAAGCVTDGPEDSPQASAVADATTSPVPLTSAVNTTTTVPTVTSTTTTTTTTTTGPPATTTPLDPAETGLMVAQELATAFADGDWETARRISPVPAWDDQTYEDGFAGLDAATLVLGGQRELAGRVVLYLFQVAHESRPGGPQTTTYCVRWDYLIDSGEIERVAGQLNSQEDGTVPVNDLRRAAWVCDGFDEPDTDDPAPAPDLAPVPAPTPGPTIDPDVELVTFRGADYACWPARNRGDLDCYRYFGFELPFDTGFPDLRCSGAGFRVECSSEDYYPSELAGYSRADIGGHSVICSDFTGNCWRYFGGSVRLAVSGVPDYSCDGSRCAPWGSDIDF